MEHAWDIGAVAESEPPRDAELVRAAQADPRAFGVLYRRHVDAVYRYLRAHTGNVDDAADLTQQVFLRALEALPRYRERGLPFVAWLLRIARNAATDWHRRRRPVVSLSTVPEADWLPAGPDHDPATRAERQDELRRLGAVIARLPADRRELLALRFGAGLTSREIAAVLGKGEAAVKKQLARTLHALKEDADAI